MSRLSTWAACSIFFLTMSAAAPRADATISKAMRYQSTQLTDRDVRLEGRQFQAFLQSDRFHKMIAGKKAKRQGEWLALRDEFNRTVLLPNPDAQRQMVLPNPDAQRQMVLPNPDAQRQVVLPNPDAQRQMVLPNPDAQRQVVLPNPDAQRQVVLPNPSAD